MRCWLLLLVLYSAQAAGAAGVDTNRLSFHLLAEKVPSEKLWNGTAEPQGLKIVEKPILSDQDFKSYDRTNYVLTITSAAGKRLARTLRRLSQLEPLEGPCVMCGPDTPFVLLAMGQPVYVGVFSFPGSSSSYSVPYVWPGPESVMIDDRSTNNIQLRIIRDEWAPGFRPPAPPDPRSDKRILAALAKLGL